MTRRVLLLTTLILGTGAAPPQAPSGSDAERWDRRYQGEDYVYGKEPNVFLRQRAALLGRGKALVLAMGEGRNAVFLAAQGFAVTGVDISRVGVEKARRLAAEKGVEIEGVVADLAEWDLGRERWDLITNFYYLDRRLFPRIVASLKPGGIVIVEHFSTDHPSVASFGPRNPDYLLAPEELLEAFEELRVLYYEDAIVELDEGMHRGPAALIRLIAKKE